MKSASSMILNPISNPQTKSFGSTLSDYEMIGEPVGKGSTSYVYKVRSRSTGEFYAMKVLDKKVLEKQKTTASLLNEIRIHNQLKCPYIVELCHTFEDEQNIYIVLEFCQGQELFQEIKAQQAMKANYAANSRNGQAAVINGVLEEDVAANYLKQIALGVKYLQERHILHRDLKLQNIMLTYDNKIKIIDFGLAIQIYEFKEEPSTFCGTPNYIPPEAIDKKRFGCQGDIWAIGCILYVMLSGTPPFESSNVNSTILKVKGGNFVMPSYFSEYAKDLINKMLNPDPKKRITINDVLEHPFIVQNEPSDNFKDSVLSSSINPGIGMILGPLQQSLAQGYQTHNQSVQEIDQPRQPQEDYNDQNPYGNIISDNKFKTIETDKDGKSGQSKGSRIKVQDTPAFNTAFSSASRQQPLGITGYKSTVSNNQNNNSKQLEHQSSLPSFHHADSIYHNIEEDQEESKRKPPSKGKILIPDHNKLARKESYRKILEFDNAPTVNEKPLMSTNSIDRVNSKEQQQPDIESQFLKQDQIKSRINIKISNMKSIPSNNNSFSPQQQQNIENQHPSSLKPSPNFECNSMQQNMRKTDKLPQQQSEEDIQKQIEIKLEQKRLKKAKFDAILLHQLNTNRLQPIIVDNDKGGYIKIRKDGWVVQFLSKQMKKLYISPDGQTMQMKTLKANPKYGTIEYKFERLPSKLKPWYKYAFDFIRITKSKTPRIIYGNNILKCYFMEDDPLNSIEVEFTVSYQELQTSKLGKWQNLQKQDVKIFYTKGSEEMEILMKEVSSGVQLRAITTTLKQNVRFQFNIHSDLEQLEPDKQFYAQEALKAIEICEQRNLKIIKALQKADQQIEFPVVIDERTMTKA